MEKVWLQWAPLVYKHRQDPKAECPAYDQEDSMKHMRYLFSALFGVALVFGISASAAAQNEITLLAPTIARKPIDTILANFQAKTSYKVKVTYVNGVATRQSVAKGQALDVSLIIAPFPGAIASGTIMVSSATPIASFLTGVAVPKGAPKPDISTPAAVKKALLAAKSIGYEEPDFTTAGQGPTEAITKLGIADQIAAKSKLCAGNTKYSANSTCFDPATGGVRSIEKML